MPRYKSASHAFFSAHPRPTHQDREGRRLVESGARACDSKYQLKYHSNPNWVILDNQNQDGLQ